MNRSDSSPSALLASVGHRPFPLAAGSWLMTQTWEKLLFAHWSLDPHLLAPLIPSALELDTFDGRAWLGVVPFRITGFTRRGLPALPYFSRCNELNVRTYAKHRGRPGVFFFSLDTDSLLSVLGARAWFRLPYFFSRMKSPASPDGSIEFSSVRYAIGQRPAAFRGAYRTLSGETRNARNGLEHWLVERYCLFTMIRGAVYAGEIHHLPWELQDAALEISENSMTAGLGLALPDEAPILHYSESLTVLLWAPQNAGT